MKKKIFALTLAASLLVTLPVQAATSPTASAVASQAVTASEAPAKTVTAPAAPAQAVTAPVSGIEAAIQAAAAEEGKTVGEYVNNAVTSVPGLPASEVTPLGQGGHVIINGAPSNQTFAVLKPVLAEVTSAKTQAAALGGKVLNVAKIKASVGFKTATVNFYTKGVKAGQNIKVYQFINGVWTELEVTEIREDHVVVNMTSLGTLAFIEVPAAN